MLEYIILALVVGWFALKENGIRSKENLKHFYISLFVFLLLVGFRYMHGDYGTYQMGYYGDIDVGGDAGYFFLQTLFHKMGLSFQVFVFVITLFSVFAFSQAFRISAWPVFGLLMILGKIFTLYAMSGIRQYIAMAICWWAISELLKNQRRMLFLAMVMVAFTIHGSAIVMLPVVFFVDRKLSIKWAVVILIISIVVGRSSMTLFGAASSMSDFVDERFGSYIRDDDGGGMNTINYIENFGFLIFALMTRKVALKYIKYYDFFLYMFIIYCGFLLAGNEIGVVKRLRDYYALSYAFIVPGYFYYFRAGYMNKAVKFIMIFYFTLLMFRSLTVFDSAFGPNNYSKMVPYHSIIEMKD